jgi:hypothetical protein
MAVSVVTAEIAASRVAAMNVGSRSSSGWSSQVSTAPRALACRTVAASDSETRKPAGRDDPLPASSSLARTNPAQLAVLARDCAKAAGVERQGVSVRLGDYGDSFSLARALKGAASAPAACPR